MNKTELISAISDKAGTSKKDSEAVLNAFIEVVTEVTAEHDKLQLVGFGTFEVAERAARTGKNPHTGEAINIPACFAPKFKAGAKLKEAANSKVKKKKK